MLFCFLLMDLSYRLELDLMSFPYSNRDFFFALFHLLCTILSNIFLYAVGQQYAYLHVVYCNIILNMSRDERRRNMQLYCFSVIALK